MNRRKFLKTLLKTSAVVAVTAAAPVQAATKLLESKPEISLLEDQKLKKEANPIMKVYGRSPADLTLPDISSLNMTATEVNRRNEEFCEEAAKKYKKIPEAFVREFRTNFIKLSKRKKMFSKLIVK